jgi:hypothetical protein
VPAQRNVSVSLGTFEGVDTRLRQAGFPIEKSLDEFNLSLSSVPQATFDYLASLEWIQARENLCLIGPAGTGIAISWWRWVRPRSPRE